MTSILNIPQPTKEKHPRQRSINISDLFLTRFTPPWSRPPSLPAYTWRNWVMNQPIAISYRETLIANCLSLDWKITPKDSAYKKELDPTIRYYTKLFQNGGNYLGTDYSGLFEWIAGDVLDLPYGGAAEIGRRGDTPGGRVHWIRPLDGGTMYPTLNQDYPAVQYYQGYDAIAFPAHAIARTYLSPQSYIYREGWGMAPPEKAYFAISLLNTGDKYYANLLLDVPTAGILDLGDMERSAAEEWVTAFKTFVNDTTTSFRVPVLYEHNNEVKYIPFGKVPNDIMYNEITLRYASLLGACYGMNPNDIGMASTSAGGQTLAGTIRSERLTRKNGLAKLKAKMTFFFNKILPESLEFNFIDNDDEQMVALGRARLATATAMNILQDNGNLTQQEIRSQIIQDGLVTIGIPDKLPRGAKEKQEAKFWHDTLPGGVPPSKQGKFNPKEPEAVGNPKAPSAGGEGDIKKLASLAVTPTKSLDSVIGLIINEASPKILSSVTNISEDEIYIARSIVNTSLFDEDEFGLQEILKTLLKRKSLVKLEFNGLEDELAYFVGDSRMDMKPYAKALEMNIKSGINGFLANTITVCLNERLLSDETVTKSFNDDYSDIVSSVKETIYKSFEDFVDVFVSGELDKVMEKIVIDRANIPDEPRIIEKSNPQPIVVSPNIHMTMPEKSDTINVSAPDVRVFLEQEPPVVNLSIPKQENPITVNVEAPTVNAPITVEQPEIHIPKQDAPIVNVSIPAQEQMPQLPPVVNVQVNPTPVEIQNTIEMPSKPKQIIIQKEGNTWTGEAK